MTEKAPIPSDKFPVGAAIAAAFRGAFQNENRGYFVLALLLFGAPVVVAALRTDPDSIAVLDPDLIDIALPLVTGALAALLVGAFVRVRLGTTERLQFGLAPRPVPGLARIAPALVTHGLFLAVIQDVLPLLLALPQSSRTQDPSPVVAMSFLTFTLLGPILGHVFWLTPGNLVGHGQPLVPAWKRSLAWVGRYFLPLAGARIVLHLILFVPMLVLILIARGHEIASEASLGQFSQGSQLWFQLAGALLAVPVLLLQAALLTWVLGWERQVQVRAERGKTGDEFE